MPLGHGMPLQDDDRVARKVHVAPEFIAFHKFLSL
jgi:hypothetical protein